mgnify:CR=1 FL=1
MLNQVVLIGRLTKDPELKVLDSGKSVLNANLAVRRSYKNEEGKYDTDFIDVVLWEGLAESFAKYAEKGSLIAIKGRLDIQKYQVNEENYLNLIKVIAEKITYL